jgi:hypothetical protein
MDLESAAKLGTYLAKDHAAGLLRLLVTYRDISASEAASRLGLHIRTAQEFLEALAELHILAKTEVFEGKRPYYRYALQQDRIVMEIDLKSLFEPEEGATELRRRIRERAGADARFTTARDNQSISAVTIWTGEGRQRKERRVNLTTAQGRFLFHLPFPSAPPRAIADIMSEAGVEQALAPEILDIVALLESYAVIEADEPEG